MAAVGLASTSSAFSADGKQVYAATGTSICAFNSPTGLNVQQIIATTDPVTLMAVAKDKIHLAYVTSTGGATPTYSLVSYNLVTATQDFSVPLSGAPGAMQYSSDCSKIILDGPDVYDAATGANILDGSELAGPFVLNGAETKVYGVSTEAIPTLMGRNLADNSLAFTAPFTVTNYTGGGLALSDRILVPGRLANGKAAVWAYRESDGSFLNVSTPSTRPETSSNPSVDPVSLSRSQISGQVFLSQTIGVAGPAPFGITERFTTSNGVFVSKSDLTTLSQPVSAVSASRNTVPSLGFPVVALASSNESSAAYGGLQLRNASTGAVLWSDPLVAARPVINSISVSPNGSYIAIAGMYNGVAGLHVLSKSDALVQSLAIDARSVAFGTDTDFVVSVGDDTVRKYRVSGGSVTLISTKSALTSDLAAVTVTATNAFTSTGDNLVRRTNFATGTLTSLEVSPTAQVKYLAVDSLGYLYVGYLDTGNRAVFKRYIIGSTTLTSEKTVSKTYANPLVSAAFAASPTGAYFAIASTESPDPAVPGRVAIYGVKLMNLISTFNQQIGSGFNAMAFAANGGDLVWTRQDAGAVCLRVAPMVVALQLTPSSVVGGNEVDAVATLSSPASNFALAMYVSTEDTSLVSVPVYVPVVSGSTSVQFKVSTLGVDSAGTTNVKVTLKNTSAKASISVTPSDLSEVVFNPDHAYDDLDAIGTVVLNGKAGPSGVVVSLSVDNPQSTIPETVTVPAGSKTATFHVTNLPVVSDTTITVTATYGGTQVTGSYTLAPNQVALVSVPKIYSGAAGTGTVTLYAPAGVGGAVVTLASDNAAVTVPASVTVLEGQTTATFAVTTTGVATATAVTITASFNGVDVTGTLDLRAPGVAAIAASPLTVTGGSPSTFTVALTDIAPAGGLVVDLVSNDVTVGTCPATVTVPAGLKKVSFTVNTLVQSTNKTLIITASRDGSAKGRAITVSRPR